MRITDEEGATGEEFTFEESELPSREGIKPKKKKKKNKQTSTATKEVTPENN